MVEVPVEVHPVRLLVLEVRIRLVLGQGVQNLVLEVRIRPVLGQGVQNLLLDLALAEDQMAEVHLARILVRIFEAIQVIVYMDT